MSNEVVWNRHKKQKKTIDIKTMWQDSQNFCNNIRFDMNIFQYSIQKLARANELSSKYNNIKSKFCKHKYYSLIITKVCAILKKLYTIKKRKFATKKRKHAKEIANLITRDENFVWETRTKYDSWTNASLIKFVEFHESIWELVKVTWERNRWVNIRQSWIRRLKIVRIIH